MKKQILDKFYGEEEFVDERCLNRGFFTSCLFFGAQEGFADKRILGLHGLSKRY